MRDILPFLKSLSSAAGLSAYEGPVLEIIKKEWEPLVDRMVTSRLGSLQAYRQGTDKGKEKGRRVRRRPSIMIATHMDAIGLIVTSITDGVIHFDEVGGIDARILPGTPVIVHGRRELPGI